MLNKKYQKDLLRQAYRADMKFVKAVKPPGGINHIANLKYLASKGLLEIQPCGYLAYEMKITFDGIEYIESQRLSRTIRRALTPPTGLKTFIWGCVSGICISVVAQLLLRSLGFFTK